jgi:F-type H+-transporting ATPase subunit gamma
VLAQTSVSALGATASLAIRGSKVSANRKPVAAAAPSRSLVIRNASPKEMRDRITSVGNTKKITDAMKLVAAAKVRKAQDAVIGARPFSESLVKVLFAINQRLSGEDVDVPLTNVRPVKTVLLIVCTGDRGLCGGFNNFIIKKTEKRVRELTAQGVKCKLVTVGKKGGVYFNRRKEQYNLVKRFNMGQSPSTQDAQTIADDIFAEFTSEEVDKVEMIYSRFVSLIAAEPTVQTLLPLSKEGEVCSLDGTCVDAANDEIFKLTSEDGEFAVKRVKADTEVAEFEGVMQFEQDPNQILEALMPLYMNAQILRALQESLASELAARMNAMSSASDNAKELKKALSLVYNRKRQAKITSEIIELVAGAAAA